MSYSKKEGALVAVLLVLSALTAVPLASAQSPQASGANYFTVSVSVSPSSLQVMQGGEGTAVVSVSPVNGTQGTVYLSAAPCPGSASCAFSVHSGTAPFTSNLTIATSTQTPLTSYTLTISAGGANKSATTTLHVTVGTQSFFSVSVSPTSGTVAAGHSIQATVAVGNVGSGSQQVSLGARGCPSGVACSLSPSSGTSPFNSTLTVRANSSVVSGTYRLIIFGAGGSLNLTTIYLLTVTQNGFTVDVSPPSGVVSQGGTVNATISVASMQPGGAGIPPVTISVSGCPLGAICGASPTTGGPPFESILDVAATGTALPGNYTITVTGTGTGYTASATYQLTIKAAAGFHGLQVTLSPPLVGVYPGQNATALVFLAVVPPGTVPVPSVYAKCPSTIICSISSNAPGASGNATLHVETYSQTLPGSYTVTVLASAGSINGSGTFTLLVQQPQSQQYTVTFVEAGLPAGAAWDVTLGGVEHNGTGNIMVSILPGTYGYAASADGYTATPSSGIVVITHSEAVKIAFSPIGSLSLSKDAVTISPGGSASVNGTVSPASGASAIQAIGESGISATVAPSGSGQFSVRVSVSASASPGSYGVLLVLPGTGSEAEAFLIVNVPDSSGNVPSGQLPTAAAVTVTGASDTTEGNITSAFGSGYIVASVDLTSAGGRIASTAPGISAGFTSFKPGSFSVMVNGSGAVPRGIVLFSVPSGMFTFSSSQSIAVYLDGSQVAEAQSFNAILSAMLSNSTVTQGSFVVIGTSSGYQILVLVPHFSSHTIGISQAAVQSGGTQPSSGPGIQGGASAYLYVAAAAAIVIVAAAALFAVRRSRKAAPAAKPA